MTEDAGYDAVYVVLRAGGAPKPLFLKPHTPQPGAASAGANAIFVAGLPLALAGPQLERLFGVFGPVLKAQIHAKRTSAIVAFEERSSLNKALRAAKKSTTIEFIEQENEAAAGATGLRRLVQEHKALFPGNEKLLARLNGWMAEYEQREEAARLAAEDAGSDGWTVVTRKAGRKRTKGAVESGGLAQAAAQEHAQRKKQKAQPMLHRTGREQRKSELVELQQLFAEAKQNLRAMREARKFDGA